MASSEEQSLTHKLQALAHKEGVSTDVVRMEFLLERLVERIAKDPELGPRVIFKGGFVSKRVYNTGRYTNDIDVSVRDIAPTDFADVQKRISVNDIGDKCWFAPFDIKELRHPGEENGLRVRMLCGLGTMPNNPRGKGATVSMDVTFFPVEYSEKRSVQSLLGGKEFEWTVCACEITVADKVHALLRRTVANSRAKDVFDIFRLGEQCDPNVLQASIKKTFEDYGMEMPEDIRKALMAVDKTGLKRAWDSQVFYIGPAVSFDAAWKVAVETIAAKLSQAKEVNLSQLKEEEKLLLKQRSKLGYRGTETEALYGLGGYPAPFGPEEMKKEATRLYQLDKSKGSISDITQELIRQETELAAQRKRVEERLLQVRKGLMAEVKSRHIADDLKRGQQVEGGVRRKR